MAPRYWRKFLRARSIARSACEPCSPALWGQSHSITCGRPADHFGAPCAICRHLDLTQPDVKRTMKTGAVLIDLDARTMHVANGPPCSNEYVPFAV
jgi:hypothetical protein